jgi:hypothetical protein
MALVIFLKVLSRKDNKQLGALQMTHQIGPQGQVSQGWEWVGVNATSDGGSWAWKKNNTTGKVSAELTSGIYKRVVASMFSKEWDKGPLPPNTPWFADPDIYSYIGNDDFPNTLEYYGPNGGMNQVAIWLLK